MKFSARPILLALISTTVIFCGCAKKEKVTSEPEPVRVVAIDKIQNRNGIFYEANQETPFTGLSQDIRPSGQKMEEVSIKDGKRHGVDTMWYGSGQKQQESNYKDGTQHGVSTAWYENGKKMQVGSYKDGTQQGVKTRWYESGQKRSEINLQGREAAWCAYSLAREQPEEVRG